MSEQCLWEKGCFFWARSSLEEKQCCHVNRVCNISSTGCCLIGCIYHAFNMKDCFAKHCVCRWKGIEQGGTNSSASAKFRVLGAAFWKAYCYVSRTNLTWGCLLLVERLLLVHKPEAAEGVTSYLQSCWSLSLLCISSLLFSPCFCAFFSFYPLLFSPFLMLRLNDLFRQASQKGCFLD